MQPLGDETMRLLATCFVLDTSRLGILLKRRQVSLPTGVMLRFVVVRGHI